MSYLEDVLLKIVESRKNGLNDNEIALKLGFNADVIRHYEDSTKRAIQEAISSGVGSLDRIANRVGLSYITLGIVSRIYGIEIPEENANENYNFGKSQEQRFEEIKRAINLGAKSAKEIGEMIGLSKRTIMIYAGEAGISLPGKIIKKKSRIERIEAIKDAIDKGYNFKEIAEEIGLSSGTVEMYARSAGIELPKHREPPLIKKKKIELIRRTVDDGISSIKEIAKITGLAEKTIMNYAREAEIDLSGCISDRMEKRIASISRVMEKGIFSPIKIARRLRIGLTTINQYLKNVSSLLEMRVSNVREGINKGALSLEELCEKSGIGKTNNLLRFCEDNSIIIPDFAERRKTLSAIFPFIYSRAMQLAREQGSAYEKALEYHFSYKINHAKRISFWRLVNLFEKYENAKNKGNTLTLTELGESIGLSPGMVGNILKRVGKRTLIERSKIKIKRREYSEATIRGFNLPLPIPDIAYFLGISGSTLHKRFDKMGKRLKFELIDIRPDKKKLNYHLVSQIYEAKDCKTKKGKFSSYEIAELAGVSGEVVKAALMERNTYEPFLIECLQDLYNDKNVKTPYVTSKMRRKLEKEEEDYWMR